MATFFMIVILLLLVFTMTVFYPTGNRRYVYLFEHSLWNGWKDVIAHFDTIEYNGYYDYNIPSVECHRFTITIDNHKCTLVYWVFCDMLTVYDYIDPKEDCLTSFDKYHCKIVKDLLCEKFDFMKQYK